MHTNLTPIAAGNLTQTSSPIRKMLKGLVSKIIAAEKAYRDRAHIASLSDDICRDVNLTKSQMINSVHR